MIEKSIVSKVQNQLDSLGYVTHIEHTGRRQFELQENGQVVKSFKTKTLAKEYIINRFLEVVFDKNLIKN
jgi:hypothetical protein